MRVVLLLLSVTTVAGLSTPLPAGVRPSTAAFRLPARAAPHSSMELRGGAPPARVEDFKLEPSTVLKLNAGVAAFFATVCIPHLPIPLFDLTGQRHENQVSLFLGSAAEEDSLQTVEVDKTLAWFSWGLYWVAGLNLAASEARDEDLKKDMCKLGAFLQVASIGLSLFQKTPYASGCLLSSAVLCAANAFVGFED